MASVDGGNQVRRIAILVTSLDAAAGRQLLSAMPSQLAREVRKAMASLTTVDPSEQRRVLAEFHSQARSTSLPPHKPAAASENSFTAIPPSAIPSPAPRPVASAAALETSGSQASLDYQAAPPTAEPASATSPVNASNLDQTNAAGVNNRAWQRFDVPALTDLLRGERATVIAVVLSQLQPQQAVELLGQLPAQQHRAIITTLSHLGDIDPEAMQAIDEHLASRVADYGSRRTSESESANRMQELLAAASPELRGQWQEIIAETDRSLADRLGLAASAPASSKNRESTFAPQAAPQTILEPLYSSVVTTADSQFVPPITAEDADEPRLLPFPSATPSRPSVSSQPKTAQASAMQASAAQPTSTQSSSSHVSAPVISNLEQILELPAHKIAEVLSAAERDVVLLALAGATPRFMQRFTALLQRADARTLQARLRQLRAINLQDIDEAQRRLCELASLAVAENVSSERHRPAADPIAA